LQGAKLPIDVAIDRLYRLRATLNALYAGFVQNLLRLCEWTSGFQSQQFQPIQAHRLLWRFDPDARKGAPLRG